MLEDSDTMINLPDGFDARTPSTIQHSSPGTPPALAINSVSTNSASPAPPKTEAASKPPSEPKSSPKEAGTTSKSSLTRGSC